MEHILCSLCFGEIDGLAFCKTIVFKILFYPLHECTQCNGTKLKIWWISYRIEIGCLKTNFSSFALFNNSRYESNVAVSTIHTGLPAGDIFYLFASAHSEWETGGQTVSHH